MRLYLTDKVSRRLILHFLLAAMIPMGGMAWYSYQQVSTQQVKTAYSQLRQDSKSFGMTVIEALNSDIDNLKQIARRDPGLHASFVLPGFSSVERVSHPDLDPILRQQIERGEATLRLAAGKPIELVVPVPGSNDIVKGRLKPSSLWVNDASPERYCVLDADFERLYCSPGLIPPDRQVVADQLGNSNGGVFTARHDGKDYLQGFWRPQYLAAMNSRGFVVMIETPKADALRDLDDFRHMFPKVALLALVLATSLAINQIRRQMKPLGELTTKTHQLALGKLDTRVELTGDDEFTGLGRAFNHMAENLQYRFNMLGMLAELDRAILSASQIEYVIQEVLKHVRGAIPCDKSGMLSFGEPEQPILITCWGDESVGCKQMPLADFNLPAMAPEQDMLQIEVDPAMAKALSKFSPRPPAELLIFAIRGENRIGYALLLAYEHPPQDVDGIAQSARALTDRLALAFSSFAQEEKLYHQAHYDALTDLPNRVLLRDRVEQALVRANRAQTAIALILIDLDNFKQVNDTQGHSTGDLLLINCALRLKSRIRQLDTLARLGGDEFVILMEDIVRGEEFATLDGVLRDLGDTLARPITLNENEVVVTSSMGVALYPENGDHFEELLKMADAAMYTSKRRQPGGFHFYSSEINRLAQDRFALTQALRHAVENDELVLYYQAKVDAVDGRIMGAEALLRWHSPERGPVPPGVFLHVLDEMGLGVWLGEWVLGQACLQLRTWQDQGLPTIPVSINFSPIQFERTPVLKLIEANLAKYRLDASRLEIEILEATAVDASVTESLVKLRELGIGIALDDFGTGYSSLVYLTRIPANILKLDRAFIMTLPGDRRQYEIVKHIISLAKALDYTIVAEGVEDEAQRALLADMGCDLIQGYLIAKPVPAAEFAKRWLKS